MFCLVINSYLLLSYVGITLRVRGFATIYNVVRKWSTTNAAQDQSLSCERLCHAMDLACVFYPKPVQCLQRSLATVILLRNHGLPAQFVTGADVGTFENHAWVELSGVVVNDKSYVREIYQVLDRC